MIQIGLGVNTVRSPKLVPQTRRRQVQVAKGTRRRPQGLVTDRRCCPKATCSGPASWRTRATTAVYWLAYHSASLTRAYIQRSRDASLLPCLLEKNPRHEQLRSTVGDPLSVYNLLTNTVQWSVHIYFRDDALTYDANIECVSSACGARQSFVDNWATR